MQASPAKAACTTTPCSNSRRSATRWVDGARVTIEFVRPAEKRAPISVALGVVGPARFAGYVDLPARGNWDLDIVIESDGQRYAATRRMFLK
jgi:nitrogen fixation protein FixH